MSYVKYTYETSPTIRNDVVVIFTRNRVEVWANVEGQHGIVGEFKEGAVAFKFIWNHYRLAANQS